MTAWWFWHIFYSIQTNIIEYPNVLFTSLIKVATTTVTTKVLELLVLHYRLHCTLPKDCFFFASRRMLLQIGVVWTCQSKHLEIKREYAWMVLMQRQQQWNSGMFKSGIAFLGMWEATAIFKLLDLTPILLRRWWSLLAQWALIRLWLAVQCLAYKFVEK